MELQEIASDQQSQKPNGVREDTKNNSMETHAETNNKTSIDIPNIVVDEIVNDKNVLERCISNLESCVMRHKQRIIAVVKAIVLLLYLAYFGYAQKFYENDEPAWRLNGITIFGVVLLSWRLLMKTGFGKLWMSFKKMLEDVFSSRKTALIIRWMLYIAMALFSVVYVIVEVAMKTPENLRSLMGIFVIPAVLFLYSNNRRKINWHTVFWGMACQFLMALIVLKTSWGAGIIRWVGDRVEEFLYNGHTGSVFLFGENYQDHSFAFGVSTQIILLMVAISVLNYVGVIDFVVKSVGEILAVCLQTTATEGINAAANIFLHLPESAMLIQNSLKHMTPSQLFVTYSGGMATVGGTSLVLFISFGAPASHLVAASAMSAPAALAAAKLVFPSHDGETVPEIGSEDKDSAIRKAKSLMESIMIGINQGAEFVVKGLSFIVTFIMILGFINRTLTWFGDRIQVENLTVEYLFSYVFYPVAFLIGATAKDCLKIGELIAVRSFSMAIVAFQRAGVIFKNGELLREHLAESSNNTWVSVGDDIYLPRANTTLVGGVMEQRSDVIATYALCGSASFALAGYVIGGYAVMVPHRIKEVTSHTFRAVVAGTAASLLTASFAGLLYEEGI